MGEKQGRAQASFFDRQSLRSSIRGFVAALLCACGERVGTGRVHTPDTTRPPGPEVRGEGAAWSVSLVDSVTYENEMGSGYLRRVRVTTPGAVDTLPGVLVIDTPVVVGDSAVHGIRYEQDRAVGLFAYERRSRRTRPIPPPAGWMEYSEPVLAPDGRHVAFLAQDPQGRGYGAVATVPERRVVYRGPPVRMLETDAGVDRINWRDAAHFEVRIGLTYTTGGEHRIRGSLAPVRVAIDTVRPDRTNTKRPPAP